MSSLDSLSDENRELKSAVNELSVLNDIATTISSTQPVEEIIERIVTKCIGHLGVEEAIISLMDPESGEEDFHTMIRRQATSVRDIPHRLDDRLTGWMIRNGEILLSNDIQRDERFDFSEGEELTFRAVLCVPLNVKGTLIGYLAAFDKKDGSPFHVEDRRMLSIIGSQSAQIIENARLYEEERAYIALKEEMRLAREIQLNLQPDREPEIAGYRFSATSIPARSVGGDYYDFISTDSGHVGFCIGDISGKGMPAALLMSNLQATFRSQALNASDCAQCLEGTNRLLYHSTEPSRFASFFYGLLDPDSGAVAYANGGHEAPLLFRSSGGEPERLEPTGLLLGVMADSMYEQERLTMEPGDLLILYSDGITEAMNSSEEEYGRDNLIRSVNNHRNKSASGLSRVLLESVNTHAGKTVQSDDITLVIIERN